MWLKIAVSVVTAQASYELLRQGNALKAQSLAYCWLSGLSCCVLPRPEPAVGVASPVAIGSLPLA